MKILSTDADRYNGRKLLKITDEFGKELEDLVMKREIVFHFKGDDPIHLAIDWRGNTAYISQYKD